MQVEKQVAQAVEEGVEGVGRGGHAGQPLIQLLAGIIERADVRLGCAEFAVEVGQVGVGLIQAGIGRIQSFVERANVSAQRGTQRV